MLELYHAEPVANSVKVLICLKEKGVEFTSHYVNLLRFEQHSPEYLAINPDGVVPALVDDGATVTESSVINEYLDDVFVDPPLRPSDPIERARMRIWTKYIDDYFGPAASRIGWHFLLHPIASRLSPEEREARLSRIPMADRREKWATVAGSSFTPDQLTEARRQVLEGVARMERMLRDRPWTAGASYSLSDIASYCVVPGLPRLAPEAVNAQATPRIIEWLGAMNERPAVQAALAMPNKVPETLAALGLQPPGTAPPTESKAGAARPRP
jgi:glutathione S-transferase